MATQEKTKVEVRAYVCCPNCSKLLLQGELVKNTIIKCENCRRRILVNIEDGKTSAIPFHNETIE